MTSQTTFEILGVSINGQSFEAVVDRVLRAPEVGERLSLHFATVHSLVEAHDRLQVRAALASGLVEPDGMPLVWLGRRAGVPVERVCGPDFMPALIAAGAPLGRRHFFYGGAPGVAERLAERFGARHPQLQVVGVHSPPFRELTADEDRAEVELINDTRPDYVWVGLGAPKQDLWVASHRDALTAPVLLAVGAAFDFHAASRRRAPAWMQRSGLEWVYRLMREPRRLAGRYTRVNARFVRLLLRDRNRTAAG